MIGREASRASSAPSDDHAPIDFERTNRHRRSNGRTRELPASPQCRRPRAFRGSAPGEGPSHDDQHDEYDGPQQAIREDPLPLGDQATERGPDRVEGTADQPADPAPDRPAELIHQRAAGRTFAPALRGSTTRTWPSSPLSAATATNAASTRVMPAIESVKARIVEPAPDRHAPSAPASRAATIIFGNSGNAAARYGSWSRSTVSLDSMSLLPAASPATP